MVSHLNILVWKWSKIAKQKKIVFLADFALQNMVKTQLFTQLFTQVPVCILNLKDIDEPKHFVLS